MADALRSLTIFLLATLAENSSCASKTQTQNGSYPLRYRHRDGWLVCGLLISFAGLE